MRINSDFWLIKTPIAHRGLWDEEHKENSISAYQRAIDLGFPIEIDVFASSDSELFCIHDDNLLRTAGVNKNITDCTKKEIEGLRLFNGQEKIPTLKKVLELCQGKTPLLIEIKNQKRKDIVERVLEELKDYKGQFAIQSFNPLYMLKVKKLAPDIIRGILGTENAEGESFIKKFIVKKMPLNFLVKPDFISYSFTGIKRVAKKGKTLALICWTVTDLTTMNGLAPLCDNVIFENFIPPSRRP